LEIPYVSMVGLWKFPDYEKPDAYISIKRIKKAHMNLIDSQPPSGRIQHSPTGGLETAQPASLLNTPKHM